MLVAGGADAQAPMETAADTARLAAKFGLWHTQRTRDPMDVRPTVVSTLPADSAAFGKPAHGTLVVTCTRGEPLVGLDVGQNLAPDSAEHLLQVRLRFDQNQPRTMYWLSKEGVPFATTRPADARSTLARMANARVLWVEVQDADATQHLIRFNLSATRQGLTPWLARSGCWPR